MQVSLIVTVFNEGEAIRPLLDSIAAQTRPADEIIISDGGSTDNTVAVLREYATRLPLKIIEVPGANISEGRNAAIKATTFDNIAVTDAGVRLNERWLAELLEPMEANPAEVEAVAGFFLADPHTAFEVAMGATVLPTEGDVDPDRFMPSSRSVAFKKSAWEAVGGYPEWLDYSEDLVFDFRLAALYGPFVFQPEAVAHFRPRSNLEEFFKQYYLYARGDGKANLFLRRHLIRYLTYFAAVPSIISVALTNNPAWLLAFIPGAAYLFGTAYRRLVNQWGSLNWGQRLIAALWIPVIRISGDIAKMIGYPGGRIWRLQNHPPDWRITPAIEDEPVVTTRWTRWIERDTWLSKRLGIAEKPSLLRSLAIFITRTGDGLLFFIVMTLIYFFAGAYWRSVVIVWLMADFLTFICVQVLKSLVRRPRPIGEWGKMYRLDDPHSFPSGHSARGGALAMIAFMLMPPIIRPLAALWGGLIAVSRILMGVHYPSDVAVGFLLGLGVTGVLIFFLKQFF